MKVAVIGILKFWSYGVMGVVNGKESVSVVLIMETSHRVVGVRGEGGDLVVKVLSKSII